jgi:hypothetical protein
MGACFSKPARSDADEADKATSSVPVPVSGTVPEQPKQDAVQHFQQLDSLPSSASVSAKLPPVLEGWTQTDVLTWAAGLGLGPRATAALQVSSCPCAVGCAICVVKAHIALAVVMHDR